MRDFLIRAIVRPLREAQRRLRPSTRRATLARDDGLRFRRRARHWPRSRKEEWILQRLRVVLREAATTPFYRDWFEEAGFNPNADFDFGDFATLPALDRDDVRLHAERMRLPGLPLKQVVKDATGGSTGQPTEVYKGPGERGWREAGGEYFMTRIGCPPGSRIGLLWGHHLDPVASDAWRDRIRTFVSNARWFDCLRVSGDQLRAYHEELQAWKPDCIVAYASALAPLAEVAAGHSSSPAYPTRCFVTGAEKLMPDDRELVQRVFRKPVHERYGSRDVGLMGFQVGAPEDLVYEMDWSNILVEPLTGEGRAPIAVTKLHADAMPMIRYRVGDIGSFPEGTIPGHPTFRLNEVVGREVDRLWLPDGNWFHGVAIPHLMKDFPVKEFRLVQAADYSVTIEVVPVSGFTDRHREEIIEIIRPNLPGVTLRIETREQIPTASSGKRRPVVSHVTVPEEDRV